MASLRETILAVDDNPLNIKMLYEMLNGEYNFISANDGDSAIQKAVEPYWLNSALPTCRKTVSNSPPTTFTASTRRV